MITSTPGLNPLLLKASVKTQARILAAIRGPDASPSNALGDDFKRKYTSPIRCWVFCMGAQDLCDYLGYAPGKDSPKNSKETKHLLDELGGYANPRPPFPGFSHWRDHATSALRAIQSLLSQEEYDAVHVREDDAGRNS